MVAWVFSVALLLFLTFGLMTWHFVAVRRIEKHLESHHADLFRELGEPRLFYDGGIATNARFRRFLNNREFVDVSDPALNTLCTAYRVWRYAGIITFAALLVVVFIGAGAL